VVIAVYTHDWRLFSPGNSELILAVWGDGHAVWSKDSRKGGKPYFSGEVDRNHLSTLMSRLARDGVFADKRLSGSNLFMGFDCRFTTLLVRNGQAVLKMQSRYDFEESGETAAAADDRTAVQVPRGESSDRLFFRRIWIEVRKGASGLMPDKRVTTDGSLLVQSGEVFWLEQSNTRNLPIGAGEPRSQEEQGTTPSSDAAGPKGGK
jgi:hypothetical protein